MPDIDAPITRGSRVTATVQKHDTKDWYRVSCDCGYRGLWHDLRVVAEGFAKTHARRDCSNRPDEARSA